MGLHHVHTTGYKASSDQNTNTQQARQLTPHKSKQPTTPWQINASTLGKTSEYVVRAENVITAGCDVTTKDVSADVTTGQPRRWGPPWTCWRQYQWPEPGEVSVRDGGGGADADQCRLLDQPGHRQPLHLPVVAAAARHRLIQQLLVSRRSQPAAWRLPVHLSGFSCSPALLPLSLSVSVSPPSLSPLILHPPPPPRSQSLCLPFCLHPPLSLSPHFLSVSPLSPLSLSPSPSPSLPVSLSPTLSPPTLLSPSPPFLTLTPFSLSPRCLCLPLCLPLSPSPPLSPFTPFLSVSPISLSHALFPSSLALLPFPSLPPPLLSPRSFCLTLCLSLSPSLVPLSPSPFPSLYLPSLTLCPALSPSSLSPLFFSLSLFMSPPLSHSPQKRLIQPNVLF